MDRHLRLDRDRAEGGPLGFIRALDEGGLIWESKPKYKSLDEVLQALEEALAAWMEENL